jgi:hypothetical protein
MAVVDTAMGLRLQTESARRLRFEPVSPNAATNVQQAIEQAYSLSVAFAQNIAQPTKTTVTAAQSPYTVLTGDRILLVDTTAGAVTINMLPAASHPLDLEIKDDKGHANTNVITVVPNGAETIDGLAPYLMDSKYTDTVFGSQTGGYYVKD